MKKLFCVAMTLCFASACFVAPAVSAKNISSVNISGDDVWVKIRVTKEEFRKIEAAINNDAPVTFKGWSSVVDDRPSYTAKSIEVGK